MFFCNKSALVGCPIIGWLGGLQNGNWQEKGFQEGIVKVSVVE